MEKMIGFDGVGSMQGLEHLTCSKRKVGCHSHPTFLLEIDRTLTRVEGGAANESERFA